MQSFPKDFMIRPARREDAPLILSFIQKIAAYEHMAEEVCATAETVAQAIFDQNAAKALIGEYKGNPVGFALFFQNFSTFTGRTGIHLEDIYVDESVRGMGFGKALFQAVAAEAVRLGCPRMEWACLDWNRPSIDFYIHMGAQPLNDWTTYRLTGDALKKAAIL